MFHLSSFFWLMIIITAIIWVIIWIFLKKGGIKKPSSSAGVFALVMLVVLLGCSTALLTTAGPNTVLIKSNGDKEFVGADPLLFFRWDAPDEGSVIRLWLDSSLDVESTISPITDNPKVRRIHYTVELEGPTGMGGGLRFHHFLKSEKADGNSRTAHFAIKDFVRSELYELNEANSKELARFYNPVRQSNEFEAFIRARLQPKIAQTGHTIKSISFEIE